MFSGIEDMQSITQHTEAVDELAGIVLPPLEVCIVLLLILVQVFEVAGQGSGRREVTYIDVGVGRQ